MTRKTNIIWVISVLKEARQSVKLELLVRVSAILSWPTNMRLITAQFSQLWVSKTCEARDIEWLLLHVSDSRRLPQQKEALRRGACMHNRLLATYNAAVCSRRGKNEKHPLWLGELKFDSGHTE